MLRERATIGAVQSIGGDEEAFKAEGAAAVEVAIAAAGEVADLCCTSSADAVDGADATGAASGAIVTQGRSVYISA